MKIIKQTYSINASIEQVWKALTDPKQIDAWGGGPAKMDDKVGTKFSLWGGEIWGENKEIVQNKMLVQDWWSETDKWDVASKVTFMLKSVSGKTQLTLTHENIPDKDAKSIDAGWKSFYLAPLKQSLES